jgi:hypothetical protein
MLGLANQSPSFAASELALHWMLDCFIRCANDPACWNNCDRKIRPPQCASAIQLFTRDSGMPALAG